MAANEESGLGPHIGTRPDIGSALLATLPFVLFGLVSIFGNLQPYKNAVVVYLAFDFIVLLGLVAGLAKEFPTWAYSYLGWSIVMAWWWSMMPMDNLSSSYNSVAHDQLLGWRSWLILLLAIGIGLLLARSLHPLRRLVHSIGEDWTLLSFMMYTFAAFAQLIYDENHHPYLAAFMLGSTLVISLGTWFYLRSTHTWKKLFSLLAGFAGAHAVGYVCYETWDWAVYYGFPEAPPQTWYAALLNTLFILFFWSVILFWPAIIGLMQRGRKKRITA